MFKHFIHLCFIKIHNCDSYDQTKYMSQLKNIQKDRPKAQA